MRIGAAEGFTARTAPTLPPRRRQPNTQPNFKVPEEVRDRFQEAYLKVSATDRTIRSANDFLSACLRTGSGAGNESGGGSTAGRHPRRGGEWAFKTTYRPRPTTRDRRPGRRRSPVRHLPRTTLDAEMQEDRSKPEARN
jgi:hypothetical protein